MRARRQPRPSPSPFPQAVAACVCVERRVSGVPAPLGGFNGGCPRESEHINLPRGEKTFKNLLLPFARRSPGGLYRCGSRCGRSEAGTPRRGEGEEAESLSGERPGRRRCWRSAEPAEGARGVLRSVAGVRGRSFRCGGPPERDVPPVRPHRRLKNR